MPHDAEHRPGLVPHPFHRLIIQVDPVNDHLRRQCHDSIAGRSTQVAQTTARRETVKSSGPLWAGRVPTGRCRTPGIAAKSNGSYRGRSGRRAQRLVSHRCDAAAGRRASGSGNLLSTGGETPPWRAHHVAVNGKSLHSFRGQGLRSLAKVRATSPPPRGGTDPVPRPDFEGP